MEKRGLKIKLFKRIHVESEKCNTDLNYLKRYDKQTTFRKEMERL